MMLEVMLGGGSPWVMLEVTLGGGGSPWVMLEVMLGGGPKG